jgi:hypothetical protein
MESPAPFLLGGRLSDPPSHTSEPVHGTLYAHEIHHAGTEHGDSRVLFGYPTLAITQDDVALLETLDLDGTYPSTALAPTYGGHPEVDDYFSFTYAVVYPPGTSALPGLNVTGGFLLKTGFVAKTTLAVVMDEDSVAVPSPRAAPVGWAVDKGSYLGVYGVRVLPSSTMILAHALSHEGSSQAEASYTAEVLVVTASGVSAIPLGEITGNAIPTMAPVSSGVAVALSNADGNGFQLYFVSEDGVSSTLTPPLPAGPMQPFYAPVAALTGEDVAIAQHGRMFICSADGCEKPAKPLQWEAPPGTTWNGEADPRVHDVFCLSDDACIAALHRTTDASAPVSALVLQPMDETGNQSATPSFLVEVAGQDLGSMNAAVLSESFLFFPTPLVPAANRGSLWYPGEIAGSLGNTVLGFGVYERAFTWTGRFLKPGGKPAPSTNFYYYLLYPRVCGGRPACERVCDRFKDCVGFTMDAQQDTCRMKAQCTIDYYYYYAAHPAANPSRAGVSAVLKKETHACSVTVKNALFPPGVDKSHLESRDLPTLLNTVYTDRGGGVYVSPTNETVISC